ncbi:MAG: ABC transporter ATP-binding protein [Candidatus Cloacimonetes bacterium]|nr:ABC transporter ATP-binding protein [Candidatus Cloacimonadota bacterium]
MLELKNITKNYGTTCALQNVNLQFEAGKIYLLLGPNGAGKTTLNQLISGILFPDQGELCFNGTTLQTSKQIPYSISYLGDTDLFDEKLSVRVFLSLIAKLKSNSKDPIQIDSVIEMFDLHDVKNKLIQNLSLGYRQRVGLAQAFLGDCDILILDEPGSGLDPLQFQELKENIHKIKENKIVIISTHRIREAKELAESVILLFNGEVLYSGEPTKELTESLIYSYTLKNKLQDFEDYLLDSQIEYYITQDCTYNCQSLSLDQKSAILMYFGENKIELEHFESSEQNLENLYFKLIKN